MENLLDTEHIEELLINYFFSKTKYTKEEIHNTVQIIMVALGREYNFDSLPEYPVYDIYIPHTNTVKKIGLLDVVWSLNNFRSLFLSVEIDSRARVQSIQKLLKSEALHRIWITYGNPKIFKKALQDLDKDNKIIQIHIADKIQIAHSKPKQKSRNRKEKKERKELFYAVS